MKQILVVLAVVAAGGYAVSAYGSASDDLGPMTGQQVTKNWEARVNAGASEKDWEFEWCPGVAVTTAVSGKQYPASGTTGDGAKAIYCQNRSSATIYLTFDATALTTTGSTGWKLAAGDEKTWDRSSTTFGPKFGAAATAATTTGACLWCAWLK